MRPTRSRPTPPALLLGLVTCFLMLAAGTVAAAPTEDPGAMPPDTPADSTNTATPPTPTGNPNTTAPPTPTDGASAATPTTPSTGAPDWALRSIDEPFTVNPLTWTTTWVWWCGSDWDIPIGADIEICDKPWQPVTISGLRDQQLQGRINQQLAEIGAQTVYANFSNVLSVAGAVDYQYCRPALGPDGLPLTPTDEPTRYDCYVTFTRTALNVRLDTGERLHLTDLFLPGTDIENILVGGLIWDYSGRATATAQAYEEARQAYRQDPDPLFYFDAHDLYVHLGPVVLQVNIKKSWQSMAIYRRFAQAEGLFAAEPTDCLSLYWGGDFPCAAPIMSPRPGSSPSASASFPTSGPSASTPAPLSTAAMRSPSAPASPDLGPSAASPPATPSPSAPWSSPSVTVSSASPEASQSPSALESPGVGLSSTLPAATPSPSASVSSEAGRSLASPGASRSTSASPAAVGQTPAASPSTPLAAIVAPAPAPSPARAGPNTRPLPGSGARADGGAALAGLTCLLAGLAAAGRSRSLARR